MDGETIRLLISVGATLVGVLLGYQLQNGTEERRRRQALYADMIGMSLEVQTWLEEVEVQLKGGPHATPIRLDLTRDLLRSTAVLSLTYSFVHDEINGLRDAILGATGPNFRVTVEHRRTQRDAIAAAITKLRDASIEELRSHWWTRLRWNTVSRIEARRKPKTDPETTD